jgi:hypothetical protein
MWCIVAATGRGEGCGAETTGTTTTTAGTTKASIETVTRRRTDVAPGAEVVNDGSMPPKHDSPKIVTNLDFSPPRAYARRLCASAGQAAT